MQLDEAERIELVYREDDKARLAAMAWRAKKVVSVLEYRLNQVIFLAFDLLIAVAVAVVLRFGLGLDIGHAVTLAALVTWLGARGYWAWSTAYATVASRGFDTDVLDEMRFVFTPLGFELINDVEHWRADWRSVMCPADEPEGLFLLIARRLVVYFPTKCWEERAAMSIDARRVEARWQLTTRQTA